MRKLSKLLLLATLLLMAACSGDFKNTKITKENQLKVIKTVNEAKKVTKDESQLFMLGTIKFSSSGGVLGRTVGEVIEAGKAFSQPAPAAAPAPTAAPATAPSAGK